MKKFVPDIVERACDFAVKAHGDQMYGDKPYYYHLRAVVSVMQAFGIWDKKILAAGYLHDVLEDTNTYKEELVTVFGWEVADMVDAVTDGTGANRKERKRRPYERIPRTPRAVTVKVADRLANLLANLTEGNKGLAKMYAKEHDDFKKLRNCVPEDDQATQIMFDTLNFHIAAVELTRNLQRSN